MKIWYGYGAEHSQNLVMIGHFKELSDAERAENVLNQLERLVNEEVSAKRIEVGAGVQRFSTQVLTALNELQVYDLGPTELEQFAYDMRVERQGTDVIITTEESDISAALKVLLGAKGKVEVYSAHHYPGEKHGRGK